MTAPERAAAPAMETGADDSSLSQAVPADQHTSPGYDIVGRLDRVAAVLNAQRAELARIAHGIDSASSDLAAIRRAVAS